jgi:hypothetical protein
MSRDDREDRELRGEEEEAAGEDRDPTGADRVTALERRSRVLLRAYPAVYRRVRGEEIIGTLLEATPIGRTWPRPRDVRALVTGGLKARAAQNRHLTTAANLRIAVMLGVALYLSGWTALFMRSTVGQFESTAITRAVLTAWPATLTGLLVAATVVLAWLAPRIVALSAALLAAAAVIFYVAPHYDMLGTAITLVLCLAALLALPPHAARPSRRWLWFVGALFLAVLASTANLGDGPVWQVAQLLLAMLLLLVAVGSIVWMGVDARLAIAVLTCLGLIVMQSQVTNLTHGGSALMSVQLGLIIAAVAAPASWLLRRQSAGGLTRGS